MVLPHGILRRSIYYLRVSTGSGSQSTWLKLLLYVI